MPLLEEIKTNGSVPPVEVKPQEPLVAKVLIGISILAYSHEFVQSFLKFWTELFVSKYPGGRIEVGFRFAYRRPVHMAQEELAEFAIQNGCTHLLLMDDDIYDVTAKDLFTLLAADKDVIGGIMFTSKFPHAMCAFRRYDIKTRVAEQPILDGCARLYEIPPDQCVGIQPADLIPFGFTLIKTSVFKDLDKPWFHCDTQAPTDSWFMDTVMDAGIKPYAHFDVWLNHNGCNRITRQHMINMGMALNQSKQDKVIVLTQEEMKRHELLMGLKMQDAELSRVQAEKGDCVFTSVGKDARHPAESGEVLNAPK